MMEEATSTIAAQYRDEFRHFIETGDASKEFLAYMDENEECQRAVERVFTEQAAHFQEFARSLALSDSRGKEAVRDLRPSAASLSMRRWNWRSISPYAVAASLVLAFLASFLAWNTALVAKHDEKQSVVFENQYSKIMLGRNTAQHEVSKLQKELTEVQGRIADITSLSTKNLQYKSELVRLRKQQSELQRTLASERSRAEQATGELAEANRKLHEKGDLPTRTVVEMQTQKKVGQAQASLAPSTLWEEHIVLEAPRLKTQTLQLPPWYAFDKEVPVNVLVNEKGEAIEFKIIDEELVSEKLHKAVKSVVSLTSFKPGTRNGEPEKMWKTFVLNFPETTRNSSAPVQVRLTSSKSPPG